MENRVAINTLQNHIDETVTIAGWVNVRRDHGKLLFLDIRDATGVIQTVVSSDKNPDAHARAEDLRQEWVIAVSGTVSKRPENMVNNNEPNGDIEMTIDAIDVLAEAKELPFDTEDKLHFDTYLDYLPLTLRHPRARAIFAVQSEIVRAYREYLRSANFTEIQVPKIVGDDAEGGGNVFRLEYFKDKYAYLATSPQLYKQIMVGVFERVFVTGNVFRAEKHSTTRHLNEYTSLDAEFGFITDHTDVMALEEKVMRHILSELEANAQAHFDYFDTKLPRVPDGAFPQMTMRDAQALIRDNTDRDPTGEPDLAPEDERFLCEYAREHFDSDFIFITHYPMEKRPFYTYPDPEAPDYTRSFDLLLRGVEITTGGQRLHEYDAYFKQIAKKGLDPDQFAFYLQAFRYGMPPHGGWGMGLERLTQKMLDLANVKEATLFPREINRIDTRLSE